MLFINTFSYISKQFSKSLSKSQLKIEYRAIVLKYLITLPNCLKGKKIHEVREAEKSKDDRYKCRLTKSRSNSKFMVCVKKDCD